MKRKRFKAEQIVVMLREAEVQMSKGLDVARNWPSNTADTVTEG